MTGKNLNICIVHPNRNAYSETFVRQHIRGLQGNIFPVYGPWIPEFTQKDERLTELYYKNNAALNVLRYACKILPAFLFNRLPDRVKGFPYSENILHSAFASYLKSNKIDIVFAEFFLKGAAVSDVCKELNIPLIVHTHGEGDIMNHFVQQNYSHLFPGLFENASAIVAVDSSSSAALLKAGLPSEKLKLIGYGIDKGLFKQSIPSQNGHIFFAVGRFTNKKAPQLTILAFEKVLKKYPDAMLYMAGAGELFDACNQTVKALKIQNSVIFCGILPPAEVALNMQRARAFLQHSVHTLEADAEGLPVCVLEAMSSGLPVISTRHNGIADVIRNGENGLLVEEFDIDQMATYMISIIDDPALADRLGAAAKKTVEEKFTTTKINAELNELIANCIIQNKIQK